jgi:hypothetical protein
MSGKIKALPSDLQKMQIDDLVINFKMFSYVSIRTIWSQKYPHKATYIFNIHNTFPA